jgi:hypothetical protein
LVKTLCVSLPLSLFLTLPGWGQTAPVVPAAQSNPAKLAFLLPGIFGPDGLLLPNPTHEAHFESDFQANFGPFNTAIGSQLTSLPLPSPASGFTYSFDQALGVYTRSAQSYGPILAERAETIGKEKFFAGFSVQHFNFSSLDGQDLHNIPSVFEHSQTTADPIIKEDIITTRNFIDTQIDQFTMFFTYGLSDRVDLSVAVPVENARLAATSNATIQRIGTANDPTIHYFLDANGNSTNQKQFSVSGTASGLGDVLMRVKGTVVEWKPVWLAAGIDVRLPTGDPYDFLGSGTLGLRPFVALSSRKHKVTPHLNAGFQWNGSSPLAGDIFAGTSGHLPNQITYAAGFDAGISKKLSVAVDVLGQDVIHSQVLRPTTFVAANGTSWQNTAFARENVNIVNGAAGFKVNPIGTLLVTFDALFRLNEAGLRSKVVPLLGFSYSF